MFVYKRGKFYILLIALRHQLWTDEEAFLCLSLSLPTMPLPTVTKETELIVYSTPDGRKERVQFDKITARVSRLCYGLDPEHVDAAAITQKVISGVYQGVTTIELDNLVG